jgi:tRNA A37 N6-isopentenylltransferase MiaA
VIALNAAIAKAEASHSKSKDVAQLHAMAASLDKDASAAKTPVDAYRMHALAEIMKQSGTSSHQATSGSGKVASTKG